MTVLENAYSTINLHDCEIKNLTYEKGNFYIYFPDGFFWMEKKELRKMQR